ncbi:MAG: hypothetical protein ABMA14_10385 [Hyphomonadaceae bacterium]
MSNEAKQHDEKICEMLGVVEHSEGWPVELWRSGKTGRLVIRAHNEAHNNSTEVDLLTLCDWLRTGATEGRLFLESGDTRANAFGISAVASCRGIRDSSDGD